MSNDTSNLALTEDERAAFGLLATAVKEDPENVALVRSTLHGQNVAVMVYIQDDGQGEDVDMRPLAVLIDDALFSRLADPASLLEGVQSASAD